MSLTDTDTSSAAVETAPSVPWLPHRRGAVDLALGFLLLVVLNVAAGTAGFWSADESVSHQQVELLSERTWTLAPPEPDVDPTGQWHTLSPISLGDGVAAPYVKHPLFPTLLRAGDMVAGRIGRHLIPAIGAVLAAAAIAVGADRRRRGAARFGFWVSLAATPLLFHGTVLWAHSLGIATAAGTCLIVQRLLEPGGRELPPLGPPHTLAFAAMAAGGVLLRSEAAIYFVMLGCCLGLFGLLGRHRPLTILGVVSIVVTLGAYTLDGYLRTAILGSGGDVALAVPPEPLLDLKVRGALTWTWLVGTRPDLGLARMVGALLLMVAAISSRPQSSLNLSPMLGLVGGLLYLPAIFSGSTMAFFPAAPALLVGVMILSRADRFAKLVGLLSALYFAAVVATSYANGGGGDWGGRYLALLLAPVAIIALPELWQLTTTAVSGRSFTTGTAPLAAGAVIASVALTVSMAVDIVDTRRGTADLAQRLAAEIDAETVPTDLVVSTDGRIGRLLGDTDVNARLLQVPGDSLPEMAERLPAGTEFFILDHLQPFDIPATWTVVDRSEHLVRVRP